MCGIFGYVGQEADTELLVAGLKQLEYRGYDSWGLACLEGEGFFVHKEVGKISEVQTESLKRPCHLAIAHTRWATHGKVTEVNAHPHLSGDGRIALVHNGIVENFQALRDELQSKGHTFASETDSEVIAHLIEEEVKRCGELPAATAAACRRLEGRYALVALHVGSNELVAVRTGSPLIVGVASGKKGTQGFFVASDVPAFLEHTRCVHYLDDGEMVVSDGQKVIFSDLWTEEVREKRLVEIPWTVADAEKGNFAHFMLKEIIEQQESIVRAVQQEDAVFARFAQQMRAAKGLYFTGSGTAHKACMSGEYFLSQRGLLSAQVSSASEFSHFRPFLGPESVVVVVSQSGETADVLEAMKVAREAGSRVLAIVNVEGSTIAREADDVLFIQAGPERGVASTKTLTGQMAVLMLLAYTVGDELAEGKKALLDAAAQLHDLFNPRYIERIVALADRFKDDNNLFIIGRGTQYPMALESAIKIQEVSYIHAEGFAAGELKHGPIALVEEGTPTITLVGDDDHEAELISNTLELKARGAYTIAIAPRNNEAFAYWLRVPAVGEVQPLLNIIPIQLFAYHLALLRGLDPDKPRNLAKSVTVK